MHTTGRKLKRYTSVFTAKQNNLMCSDFVNLAYLKRKCVLSVKIKKDTKTYKPVSNVLRTPVHFAPFVVCTYSVKANIAINVKLIL